MKSTNQNQVAMFFEIFVKTSFLSLEGDSYKEEWEVYGGDTDWGKENLEEVLYI